MSWLTLKQYYVVSLSYTHLNASVPAQLNSLARTDSRQTGPGLIWRESNWVKESQYGLDHETIEQNEFTGFMSPMNQLV